MAYDVALQSILDREPEPPGGIESREVDYMSGDTACRGYLARPAADRGARAAVLVVHDWLGVWEYVRMRCDMLARLGYVAFAVDVYGADVRPDERHASKVSAHYYGDRDLFRERLTAGLARLLEEPEIDASRVAAIGYCFGGAGALELARTGADLAAVVSFHGGLMPGLPGDDARIRARLLVLTGASDPVVPDDKLLVVENGFREQPALDWQVVLYSGAMHAFTNPFANAPDHGAEYDAVAEQRSWTAMKAFFDEVLT